MKRTQLRRKTPLVGGKSLRRSKGVRKVSKAPISKLQRQVWELCKQITRKRYGNVCYTCDRGGLEGSNWHTGHMFAKGALGAYLKYDLRLLRPQCYNCNINHGGRGADFIEKMRAIEGDDYVDAIIRDRQVTVEAYEHYSKILEEYGGINR